jgi:endonuclease/exonuclease/phosphatase (EEP) superfamily protein YafD
MMRPQAVAAVLSLVATSACLDGITDVGDSDDEDLLIEGKVSAEIRAVQHNVWKQQSAINHAISKAQNTDAHVIMLEELCPGQKDAILSQYGAQWTIGVVAAKRPAQGGCPLPDGTQEVPFDVVIYRGKGGSVKAFNELAGPLNAPGNKMVCVLFERANVPVHACAIHLISADWTDPATGIAYQGDDIRDRQATAVKKQAREWLDKGHFVILGGDFNSTPNKDAMNKFYDGSFGGGGDFTEYNRPAGSRDGEATTDAKPEGGGARKIDYIFFSTNRAPINGDRANIVATDSDHNMVVSKVQMKK